MEPAINGNGCRLPLPSLHLLVSPVRLMSAFMWQVVQQRSVSQYDKVADFIGLVMHTVPELLDPSQTAQLLLGLRARLVLDLCQEDVTANLQTIQGHLDKFRTCVTSIDCRMNSTFDKEELRTSYTNFAKLVQLLTIPSEKEHFFQELFPVSYGPAYDLAIQKLVCEFLSRLEQLLPVPDYTQMEDWLPKDFSGTEDFGKCLSDPFALKTLLLHHRQLGTLSSGGPFCSREDIILSTLARLHNSGMKDYSTPYTEDSVDDDIEYIGEEEVSSNIANDKWLQLKESHLKKSVGLISKLVVCSKCSFAHRVKKVVEKHMATVHQVTDSPARMEPLRKSKRKARQKTQCSLENRKVQRQKSDSDKNPQRKQKVSPEKKRESNQKRKHSLESKKEQCMQKEPSGEDRRFLSTRPVNKNFTEEEIKCPQCAKVFELPNQLKTHLKLHTLLYHCDQCEKGFTSKSGYNQHQRLHKRGRLFTCSHCNMGFLCVYSLKQHERIHTEGPTHTCTICGKLFSKGSIVRHMRMHKGEKNYLCPTCGKSFLSSAELQLHIRHHTGETPYTCTHCGKGFSCHSHLIVHVRSHTGDRPYPCSACPKRFVTLNCLKRHMLCHNGIKPYKCPVCDKQFTQQGNLKRHVTTHHQPKL